MRIYWMNGSLRFAGESQEETDALLAFHDMLESSTLKVGEAAYKARQEDMDKVNSGSWKKGDYFTG